MGGFNTSGLVSSCSLLDFTRLDGGMRLQYSYFCVYTANCSENNNSFSENGGVGVAGRQAPKFNYIKREFIICRNCEDFEELRKH